MYFMSFELLGNQFHPFSLFCELLNVAGLLKQLCADGFTLLTCLKHTRTHLYITALILDLNASGTNRKLTHILHLLT